MHKLFKQAFTLIELLVVIAIIGILSGLIIVGMSGMTQKATIAKAQVFSNSLRNSLMMNIVGEWKFDGATSERPAVNADVVDSWGGVNNGTIPASPSIPTIKTASNCVSGSCLSFDGVDDYVESFSEVNIGTGPVTLSVWAKSNASIIREERGIVSFYNSSRLWFFTLEQSTYDNSSVTLYIGYPDQSPSVIEGGSWPIGDTNWHHVVVTRDSSTISLYFDGTLLTHSHNTNYTNFDIGNRKVRIGAPSEKYFNGLIDDVRIYNAAMPTSQIKEQYYAGLNKLLANGGITKEEYQNKIGGLATKL